MARVINISAVAIATNNNIAIPHEDIVKYFRNKINSGAYKTKIIS